jgi:transcriptional regulator with XRE-family HTH domain
MSLAFVKANRARRYRRGATQRQREHLARLAERAGVETPSVAWCDQASDAITQLERHLREPTLSIREEPHARC